MLAYRVNLSGTHDHYLITEKQKPALDQAMAGPGRGTVTIGGDTIRVSSIKSITQCDVDLESCPAYFQKRVILEREQGGIGVPGFHKFPTEWLLLTLKGEIIKTDVARNSVAEVTRILLAQGDPEENKDLRFIAAKCHFKFGTDGEKQYFVAPDQIPEALRCFPNAEAPDHMVVRQIYHYGIPQWPAK